MEGVLTVKTDAPCCTVDLGVTENMGDTAEMHIALSVDGSCYCDGDTMSCFHDEAAACKSLSHSE